MDLIFPQFLPHRRNLRRSNLFKRKAHEILTKSLPRDTQNRLVLKLLLFCLFFIP